MSLTSISRAISSMSPDLVIGVDSSTTATKAIAWDRGGRAVAEGRAAITLNNPEPGFFEQDPVEWWTSTASALRDVTSRVDPTRIAGLAISNQRETFALFRRDGSAVRPGTVWLDERSRSQEKSFGRRFGAQRLHEISGKPLDVIPCLFRVLWHAEHEPAFFAEAEMFADVHGFLSFKLTGDWATSTASADPMGILDMRRMCWSCEILEAAGIDTARLPRLVRPGQVIGEVTAQAASITGLRPGTRVVAGGGDGQCAGTGVNLLAPGDAYVNLGTAVVSGSFGVNYAFDPAYRTEVAIADQGYIFETCLRAGTFLIDWFVRELCTGASADRTGLFADLEQEAASAPIGAGGLLLIPYWQGCMNPHWDSHARGFIAGLSGSTKRSHIYRALLEGIALEQAVATDQVARSTGVPIDSYTAVGGGAASDLWAQILADASNRAVTRTTTVEASSLGAAMAAAAGADLFGSIAEAANAMAGRSIRTFGPVPAQVARYAELKAIYADLWPLLATWNRRLATFAGHAHV